MKLLFLTEKPALKQWIEQEFARFRNDLCYTIDVACVNCFIISEADAARLDIDTRNFMCLTMHSRTVPDKYLITHKCGTPDLPSLLRSDDYTYIVNACDPDESGELAFAYALESCNALDRPTLKFDVYPLLCKFQSLEPFKQIEALIETE